MRWVSQREHEAAIRRLQRQIDVLTYQAYLSRRVLEACAEVNAINVEAITNRVPVPDCLTDGSIITGHFSRKTS
jgi:hypothetical protein